MTSPVGEGSVVLYGEIEEAGGLHVQLGPLTGIGELSGHPGQGIHNGEDGELPLLSGDLHGFSCDVLGQAVLQQDLEDFFLIAAEFGLHGLLDGIYETITSFISLVGELLNVLPDEVQAVMHLGGVLSGELGDFYCIPHDVVLADGLKPKRLDSYGALANLRIPQEEAGSEGLPVDLGPPQWVDQEDEHILFPTVEAAGTSIGILGGLEFHRKRIYQSQEVRIEEAGVGSPVDRPQTVTFGEKLERFAPRRKGIQQDIHGGGGADLVDRVPRYTSDLAHLTKTPRVQGMIPLLPQFEGRDLIEQNRAHLRWGYPFFEGIVFLLLAVSE